MKKVFVILTFLAGGLLVNAQDASGATSEGNWLIEANTGFGSGAGLPANTGFGFFTSEGATFWSVGGEFGYFIIDDLAIKAGLGYSYLDLSEETGSTNTFAYKVGLKYYAGGIIPLQVDFTGVSVKDAFNNPYFLGLQGGYAIFISDSVSVEPGLRYNINLNNDLGGNGIFEVRFGFVIHI